MRILQGKFQIIDLKSTHIQVVYIWDKTHASLKSYSPGRCFGVKILTASTSMMRCVHFVFVFMFSLGGEHGDPDQKFVVKKTRRKFWNPTKVFRFSAIKKRNSATKIRSASSRICFVTFFGNPTKRCTITLLLVSNTFLCSPWSLGKWIQFDFRILFRWVGSPTKWNCSTYIWKLFCLHRSFCNHVLQIVLLEVQQQLENARGLAVWTCCEHVHRAVQTIRIFTYIQFIYSCFLVIVCR